MNGIVYKHYERWYKNYHSAKIIPVEVVSRDVLSEPSLPQALPVYKQNDRNNRHNKHTFGKSSLKSSTRDESTPSREEEKRQYSTPDSLAGEEADKASPSELDESKVMSEPLDKKRGSRGPYDLMDAARVELVDCNTALVPCGMKILGTKTVGE